MAFEDSALRHGCWDATLSNLPEANSDLHLKNLGHGKTMEDHVRPFSFWGATWRNLAGLNLLF